ncbi:unnamed protein product [Prunus armeniaca]
MLDCLKKRLEDAEGKWVDELPGVLWAYRTTKRRSIGETLFSLAYETEAIIPPHITVPSMSIEVGSLDQNYKQMKVNLDMLEEGQDQTVSPWRPCAHENFHHRTKTRVKEDEAKLGKPLRDQSIWGQRKLHPRHSRRERNSETMECPPHSKILSMKLFAYQLCS